MWVDVHVYVFVSVCKQVNMLNAPHTKTPANTHTHTPKHAGEEGKPQRNKHNKTKKKRKERKLEETNARKSTFKNETKCEAGPCLPCHDGSMYVCMHVSCMNCNCCWKHLHVTRLHCAHLYWRCQRALRCLPPTPRCLLPSLPTPAAPF